MRAKTVNNSVNNSPENASAPNHGEGPTGNSQAADTVVHINKDNRPEWEERGRIACRQGRRLTPYPFGPIGLTPEGHIRAAAWIKGWSVEAMTFHAVRESA